MNLVFCYGRKSHSLPCLYLVKPKVLFMWAVMTGLTLFIVPPWRRQSTELLYNICLQSLFVMENVTSSSSTCWRCQRATHMSLGRGWIMFIHLQDLARGIKMEFVVDILVVFFLNGRITTRLRWFGGVQHTLRRKRKLLRKFDGECAFSGPWRIHCPVFL